MEGKRTVFAPLADKLNNLGSRAPRRNVLNTVLPTNLQQRALGSSFDEHILDLAPVMPAIDAVQQLIEEESRSQKKSTKEYDQRQQQRGPSSVPTISVSEIASTSSAFSSNVIKNTSIVHQQQQNYQDQDVTSQLERSSSNSDTSKLNELSELLQNNLPSHSHSNATYSDTSNFLKNAASSKEDHLEEESYDKVLWNYSSATAGTTLSSTPEMRGTMAACAAPHTSNQGSTKNTTLGRMHKVSNENRPSKDADVDLSHKIKSDNGSLRQHKIQTRVDVRRPADYEIIPKSAILDVYSNDPEVERFLQQLPKIGIEHGYNEQEYKCYSCRRPIGMVFGQSRLCKYDGHLYCTECHLDEKVIIPARILCNWDFKKYPVSKRNQHFLDLISTEPMFDLKIMSPLLYSVCVEMREMLNLRSQAFFLRSYCFTCTQDSISFELTKLVWPREHLIEHIHLYSLEDLEQVKSGALAQLLKSVVSFGRRHVLTCMLCCQKGFICEICKSPQIIYPFDTDSVYRCHKCRTVFHLECFSSLTGPDCCPRCNRLQDRTKKYPEKL